MSENAGTIERGEAPEVDDQHVHADPEREAVEAEARRQGWRPKEEFSGSGAWVDAPEFVERGKQFQHILKRENRELREQISEMVKRDKERDDVFKEFREHQKQTSERAYARAKRDLEAQRDTAAAAANMDDYRRSQQQLDDLESSRREEERKPTPQTPAPQQDQPRVDPYVAQWGRENPWFNTDPDANAFAQAIHVRLSQEQPDLSIQENLAEVRRRVVKRFPELFGNARRDAASSVSRPSGGNGRQPKKEKGYDDLPADAKAACDRFVKQGLYENRDAYCKEYDWEAA